MMFLKYDSDFNFIFTKIADLFILNILFILCSLPIFTIGASYTALYECVTSLKDDSTTSLVKDFFKTFKSKFKYSFIAQLAIIILTIILWSNFLIILSLSTAIKFAFIVILALYFIVLASFVVYIYPIICRYDMKFIDLLRVTFAIAIKNPLNTLSLIIINFLPLIIMLVLPIFDIYIILFMTFLGFSLISFLSSILLEKIFKTTSITLVNSR